MNYYQHHIGDFIRDTSRLSDSQCMAYLRLMWIYYEMEQPIEGDIDAIAFRIGATSSDVAQIFKHFFFLHDDGLWHQARCDKEILAFRKKSEKAKDSANARWNNANAMRTHSERIPNAPVLDANQEPVTSNQEPIPKDIVSGKPPTCPHLEIIDLYNRLLPELPAVIPSLWDGPRKTHLQTRWRESEKHQSLDFWERFFTSLRSHDFYLGNNDRGWRADLGWLIEKKHFTEMIERFVSANNRPTGFNNGQAGFSNSGNQRPDTSAAGQVRANIARARAERAAVAGCHGEALGPDGFDVRPQVGEQLRGSGGPGSGMGELLEGDYRRAD